MSHAAFDDLRQRLAEIADLGSARAPLLGPADDDAAARRSGTRRAARDARPDRARKFTSPEIGRLLDDLAASGAARLRLVRGEPDSRHASRLGEGAQGAVRPARGDVALGVAREPCLGRRAPRTTTSRRSCLCSGRTSTCASATSTASSRRRAVRRRARRLRARHEDGRGAAASSTTSRSTRRRSSRRSPKRAQVDEAREDVPDIDAQKIFELEVVRAFGFTPTRGGSTRRCTRSRRAPA